MTNVIPLRAEGQITWREFPIESKWSPEAWEDEVYRRWHEHKQYTKDRWESYLRKIEQDRLY